MIEYNRCLIIKNKFWYVIESNTFHFYKIIHPRRCAIKCRNRNGSGLQHCIDSGTIAVQCGLSKRIWFNQYQIFQTLLTHNTHKSQKNWSFVQSDWSNVMKFACHRSSVFKTGLYERHSLSRTPSAESWQFRTVRSGRGTGWPYFLKSPNDSVCPQAAGAGVARCFFFYFDAQASDIRIEMRQVVFLCRMQDSNPEGLWNRISSRLNARWQTDWAIEDQAIENQAKNFNSTARPYDQRAWYPKIIFRYRK